MPKRWLSRRGRQQNTILPVEQTTSNESNHSFDFAFSTDSPASLLGALPSFDPQSVAPLHNERPTTSSGIESRSRKKLRIDINANRPKTSEGNRASLLPFAHRHAASRSQDDLIGVAFGSPGHPPVAFRSLASQMSPRSPDHAFGHQGPLPEKQRRLLPKSWKKFGALFTVKHALSKPTESTMTPSPALNQQPQADKSEESLPKHHWFKHKPSFPEQPTRCPPPPPRQADEERDHFKKASKRKSSSEGKTMLFDPTPLPSPNPVENGRKSVERPTRLSSLPKLEINIPNPPLDRYSVLFKSIPAASGSSSLLARRSKTLDGLKSSDSSHNNSQSESEDRVHGHDESKPSEGEFLPPRRMTDPKLPKPEFPLKNSTSSPTISKYTLFPPASPLPVKIMGKTHHESPLKRTASSPARLSPMQPNFPNARPHPLSNSNTARKPSAERYQDLVSPEANTASTEASSNEPWSALHSMKSSVSSSNTDEIFFDIKSFRDSKGLEDGQHFVMARPDSTVVQIARTRSKLNKGSRAKRPVQQQQQSINDDTSTATRPLIIPSTRADKHFSASSVNTAVFDEAIAAVEELTSPQATRELSQEAKIGLVKSAETVSTQSKPNVARQSSLTKKDLDLKLLPPDPVLPGRTQSKGRSEHAGKITVPSPISEEVSPMSNKAISPEKPQATISANLGNTSLMPPQPQFAQAVQPATKPGQPQTQASKPIQASASTATKPVAASTTATSPPRNPVPVSSTATAQPKSQPIKPTPSPAANPTPAKSPRLTALRRADHPIEESPTIPQGPPPRPYSPSAALTLMESNRPPPVPAKDSKFIPISKFAARNTVSNVEKAGIRPTRPVRSATDTLVTEAHQAAGKRITGLRKGKVERSATIPAPSSSAGSDHVSSGMSPRVQVVQVKQASRPSPQLVQSKSAGNVLDNVSKDSPTLEESGVHTVTAIIQAAPTAEVSVARTVSLSRKQSARVLVPGPKLAARRKEASEQEEEMKRRRKDGEDAAPVSAAAMPVLVTISSPKEQQSEFGQGKKPSGPASVGSPSPERGLMRTPTPDIKTKLNPLTSHPMDSQISLVSQNSQLSYTSEISTMSKAQEKVDKELIEKFREKDKSKWDVAEAKRMSPIVVEGHRGHKPGASVGVVLDMV